MENLWNIISDSDNIPIVLLVASLFFFYGVAVRQIRARDRGTDPLDRTMVLTYPYLVRLELLAAMVIMIALTVWSITLDAPLEEEANPALTPNPAKAPWYFVGLQEMLVYFDPWIAGVMLPLLIIFGLMAIPYLDFNRKCSGGYTFRERWLAITIFSGGFLLWVALIAIGTFCRGPGWMWFWPWQEWDPYLVVVETNVNLHQVFGIHNDIAASLFGGVVVVGYYLAWLLLPWRWLTRRQSLFVTDRFRYLVFILLLASLVGLPIKMLLRLLFHIQYVLVTPWFNV